jgi:hypothetical protein
MHSALIYSGAIHINRKTSKTERSSPNGENDANMTESKGLDLPNGWRVRVGSVSIVNRFHFTYISKFARNVLKVEKVEFLHDHIWLRQVLIKKNNGSKVTSIEPQ